MADRLHHEDGSHRTTAPTANGTAVATHERAIAAHLADRHEHCARCGGTMRVSGGPKDVTATAQGDLCRACADATEEPAAW